MKTNFKHGMSFTLIFCGVLSLGWSENATSDTVKAPQITPAETLPILPSADFTERLPILQSFFQIAGQIRYHHPGDAVAKTNWESFLAETAYRIAIASNDEEALKIVRFQLSKIAPDISFNGQSGANRQLDGKKPVRVWRQDGYADEIPSQMTIFRRERIDVSPAKLGEQPELPAAPQFEYRDKFIQAVIPQANLVINNQTLPAGSTFSHSADFQIPTQLEHPMVCLASAGEIWSIIANFFPYLQQVQVDWQAELLPMLASCVKPDRAEFDKQLHVSLTKLQDNHIRIMTPFTERWLGSYYTAVRFDWIEDKLVVIHKTEAEKDISLGDQLLEINGRPVKDVVEEMSRYALTSPHLSKSIVARDYLLRGQIDTKFDVMLQNASGTRYSSVLKADQERSVRWAAMLKLTQQHLPQFQQLSSDIAYVNVSKTTPDALSTTLTELQNSKAVVLDLRNYPQSSPGWKGLLAHFTPRPMVSMPVSYHFANHPDPKLRYQQLTDLAIPAKSPLSTMPVVVLSSRYSISQSEHALSYAQSIGIPVLGEVTTGINGNPTEFVLLGGLENKGLAGVFTGMTVNQHDGSRFIGVGIQPDILVPLTIEGIVQQQDVQLEAAIQYLNQRLLQKTK